MPILFNKKGVTPLLAAVLLIMIAVAGFTALRSMWQFDSPSQQPIDHFKIVQQQAYNDSVIFDVLNMGYTTVTIANGYVEDADEQVINDYVIEPVVINPGETKSITLTGDMNFIEPRNYRLVSQNGYYSTVLLMLDDYTWTGYSTPLDTEDTTPGNGDTTPGNGDTTPGNGDTTPAIYQLTFYPIQWNNMSNPFNSHYKNSANYAMTNITYDLKYNDSNYYKVDSVASCYQGIAGIFKWSNVNPINQSDQIINITFTVLDNVDNPVTKIGVTGKIDMLHYICMPNGTIIHTYDMPSYSASAQDHIYKITITNKADINKILVNGNIALFVFADGVTKGMHGFTYRANLVSVTVSYYHQ